jgi:nucleotide-binding universal stress UspA family protein
MEPGRFPHSQEQEMFRHILVPTDGSAASNRAVALAIDLARASRGRITAMHVVASLPKTDYLDAITPYPELYSPGQLNAEAESRSKALLEKVAGKAKAAGVACQALTDKSGTPWKAIIRAAKSKDCDVVVMASHGRRGLEAVILGSETHKVLTHSKVPVLVCR